MVQGPLDRVEKPCVWQPRPEKACFSLSFKEKNSAYSRKQCSVLQMLIRHSVSGETLLTAIGQSLTDQFGIAEIGTSQSQDTANGST